jgi:hypothetical protein
MSEITAGEVWLSLGVMGGGSEVSFMHTEWIPGKSLLS